MPILCEQTKKKIKKSGLISRFFLQIVVCMKKVCKFTYKLKDMNNRVKMYEKGDTIVISNNALGVPNICLGRSGKIQSISHQMNGNVVYDVDCVYNEKGHYARIFLFNSDIKCKL